MRLGAGPSSATLVNLHIVRRVAPISGEHLVYYGGDDVPVFLLALIDKRQRENLSAAEKNELARILPQIADAYRKGSKT